MLLFQKIEGFDKIHLKSLCLFVHYRVGFCDFFVDKFNNFMILFLFFKKYSAFDEFFPFRTIK